MREALKGREGARTLAHLQVVESMGESLEREERVIGAEQKALHEELYGAKYAPGTAGTQEGEPVKILVGSGDVKVIYGSEESQPPPRPPEPQQPTQQPKPANPLVKAALAAAIASLPAIGAGVGFGIPWLLGMFDKPAAEYVDTDTDTQYELRFPEPPGK